jgi:hypothetical protein
MSTEQTYRANPPRRRRVSSSTIIFMLWLLSVSAIAAMAAFLSCTVMAQGST